MGLEEEFERIVEESDEGPTDTFAHHSRPRSGSARASAVDDVISKLRDFPPTAVNNLAGALSRAARSYNGVGNALSPF